MVLLFLQRCHNNMVVMFLYPLLNLNSELKPVQCEISINKSWKLLSLFSSETMKQEQSKLVPKCEIKFYCSYYNLCLDFLFMGLSTLQIDIQLFASPSI